jgi:hypothetical protein
MQMSKGAEYSIEGILYLARRCGDEPRATAQSHTPEDFLQATS